MKPTKKGIMIDINDFLDLVNEIDDIKKVIYDIKKKKKENWFKLNYLIIWKFNKNVFLLIKLLNFLIIPKNYY